MAISAATKTSDFSGFLTPTQSAPIFERAARTSVVQRLVQQVPLGANGVSVPVVTGRPSAGWVDEGATKPASSGSMTLKTITPKKLAAILVVSAEVVRANPGNYVNTMRNSLAEAFAVAFDRAALHDEGPDGTGSGGPFSTYLDQTTKVQEIGGTTAANGGIHVDLVEAMKDIVTDKDASGRRYQLTGWALDSVVEPLLWGAVDTAGRPLYTALATDDIAGALNQNGRLKQETRDKHGEEHGEAAPAASFARGGGGGGRRRRVGHKGFVHAATGFAIMAAVPSRDAPAHERIFA